MQNTSVPYIIIIICEWKERLLDQEILPVPVRHDCYYTHGDGKKLNDKHDKLDQFCFLQKCVFVEYCAY